jgi:hypothetical protein
MYHDSNLWAETRLHRNGRRSGAGYMCGADFTAILPPSKSSMVSGKLSGQNNSLAVPDGLLAALSRNRFERRQLVKHAIVRDDQPKSRETLPL